MRARKTVITLALGAAVVVLLSLSVARRARADDTGWLNPSSNAADSGGDDDGFELTPQLAYADGGGQNARNRNSGPPGPGPATERHRYYDYGFSIPSGSTIEGIEVRLDWWLSDPSPVNEIGVELSYDGGTNWSEARSVSGSPISQTTTFLGGASDTWGRSWVSGDFSDASFRVRIICYSSQSDSTDFYLDWVPVRVTYSGGTPGQISIQKGVSPQVSETPGQAVTYTYVITISNAGPSNARVEQIVDTLPTGFTYVTTTATSGIDWPDSILGGGSSVTWSYSPPPYPSISVDAYATLTFEATSSNSIGGYCNTVAVTCGGGIGTVTGSNLACVTIRWPTFDIETEVRGMRTNVRARIEDQPVILSWEIIP